MALTINSVGNLTMQKAFAKSNVDICGNPSLDKIWEALAAEILHDQLPELNQTLDAYNRKVAIRMIADRLAAAHPNANLGNHLNWAARTANLAYCVSSRYKILPTYGRPLPPQVNLNKTEIELEMQQPVYIGRPASPTQVVIGRDNTVSIEISPAQFGSKKNPGTTIKVALPTSQDGKYVISNTGSGVTINGVSVKVNPDGNIVVSFNARADQSALACGNSKNRNATVSFRYNNGAMMELGTVNNVITIATPDSIPAPAPAEKPKAGKAAKAGKTEGTAEKPTVKVEVKTEPKEPAKTDDKKPCPPGPAAEARRRAGECK